MAAKKEDNTGFFLIGAVFLVILLVIILRKSKTNRYGIGYGYGSNSVAGGGQISTGIIDSLSNGGGGGGTGFICKGARGNKVKEIQNYFVMTYGANLKIDGIWGRKTQNQVEAYYTQKGQNPQTCLSENDYNLMSGRF